MKKSSDTDSSSLLVRGIRELYPGYFALVMATGIISEASFALQMTTTAWILMIINIIAYGVLCSMLIARLLFFGRSAFEDLRNYQRGPGYFTVVAGTCVLGNQIMTIVGFRSTAYVLWIIGIVLWSLVSYSFFTLTIIRDNKPNLETGINGAWLIAIVATQSVSILGTQLVSEMGGAHELMLFFALCMYLLGAMLYLTIITMIFLRFTFLTMTLEELTPPYWINMGAVAITTLAGSNLLIYEEIGALVTELRAFIMGFTLFFWATATWWVPLLVILGVWRHIIRRFPLNYDSQNWGMVFPLGMYTICTYRLAGALNIPFLIRIPQIFIWIAITTWCLTFAGMLAGILRSRQVAVESI